MCRFAVGVGRIWYDRDRRIGQGACAVCASAAGSEQLAAQLLLPGSFPQHAGLFQQPHIGQDIAVACLCQLLFGIGGSLLCLQFFQQAAHAHLPSQTGGFQFGAVAFQQALLGTDAVLVAVGIEVGLAYRLPYLAFGSSEQFVLLQFTGSAFSDAAVGLAAVV